jgi:hypothetical protein
MSLVCEFDASCQPNKAATRHTHTPQQNLLEFPPFFSPVKPLEDHLLSSYAHITMIPRKHHFFGALRHVLLVSIILVMLLTSASAAKTKLKLPSCDQARKLYEKNKLYDTLGVTPKATDAEIKRNFRKMSVQCA